MYSLVVDYLLFLIGQLSSHEFWMMIVLMENDDQSDRLIGKCLLSRTFELHLIATFTL